MLLHDRIRTDAIHETSIKPPAGLISEDTPYEQYRAARLTIFHLRKLTRQLRSCMLIECDD